MWPIAWAVVPSSTNVNSVVKTRKSDTPMTISGVTIGKSETNRTGPEPRPRQRTSPIASATPSGTAIRIEIARPA